MKTLLIIAPPGHGKTTLVRRIIDGPMRMIPFKHHVCTTDGQPVVILGDYSDDNMFSGTDKLQMDVQPKAIEFIKSQTWPVIAEGDRLANQKFIDIIRPEILYIHCDKEVVRERLSRRERGDSEELNKFIKSRKTKVNNLRSNNGHYLIHNNSEGDKAHFDEFISDFLQGNLYRYEKILPIQQKLF